MEILIYVTLVAFLIYDFVKQKINITPIKVFNSIWLVTLILYSFNLSYIQQQFSDRTLLIFFLCILFYNVFGIVFSKINFWNFKKIYNPKISVEKRLKIINVLFVIVFIVECIYSKGLPVVFRMLGQNSNYMSFGIPSVHGALNGLAICLGAYYLFKKDKRKYIYIIFGLLTLSRQVLMSLVVEGIIFHVMQQKYDSNEKSNKKLSFIKYILFMVVLVIGFIILGNFRSGSDVMSIVFMPRVGYENLPSGVMWIYSYMTFSLSNFNNLVSLTNGFVNYGTSILNFFLPTVVLNIFNIVEPQSINYLIQSNFNVSTALPELYLDFGIVGIVIFSIFISYLGQRLYVGTTKEFSIEKALCYSVFVHNVIFFFFVNMFIYIPIVAQFFYIPLLFREPKLKK